MKTRDALARKKAEGLEAYIARLEGLDRSGLSEDDQLALTLSLQLARKKLRGNQSGAAVPAASPLEQCKQAVRGLTAPELKQFLRWISNGMPR